jgi:proteasome accessory factor B
MRTVALQRISNLEIHKVKFTRQAGFNARDHLGGGFGVWSYAGEQKRKHEVHIQLEGYAARIVAERQWHPTQAIRKIKPDGSIIEFQADLAGLEEITRWVLSWGSKARVLEPPELVERVAREVEGIVATYT